MEYFSSIKKNEFLRQAKIWINLENIMLKIEARHKSPHIIFHLPEVSRMQIHRERK